jgi:hypothetical protein
LRVRSLASTPAISAWQRCMRVGPLCSKEAAGAPGAAVCDQTVLQASAAQAKPPTRRAKETTIFLSPDSAFSIHY